MKNTIKNTLYAGVGLTTVGLHNVTLALDPYSTQGGSTADNNKEGDFITTLDNILGYIIGLLYFITLVFALYGGFQILTAGGDEEKVKKGKTTLIQAVIGLLVIFLASQIVSWIIGLGGSTVQ